MTDLQYEVTPELAAASVLGVCKELSLSAGAVSGAQLAQLTVAELAELRRAAAASAKASDDPSVIEWCTRVGRLVVADFCRRSYEQMAVDAKAEAILAEERRLACVNRAASSARSVSPSSGV